MPRLIALTGGPGAGKTAVLEMASRAFCRHVAILPEAAGIVFGGGFPRAPGELVLRASQRAIFGIQREVERLVLDEGEVALGLCDRGSIDGVAYWPGPRESFFTEFDTSIQLELARYAAVIHLETPHATQGYNRSNALRVETAEEARVIDERIADAWRAHPRRFTIPSTANFVDKALLALAKIRGELPECCRSSD
ncbi:MAG: ATP-binding protein [Polyangiales bacterium]